MATVRGFADARLHQAGRQGAQHELYLAPTSWGSVQTPSFVANRRQMARIRDFLSRALDLGASARSIDIRNRSLDDGLQSNFRD